MDAVTGETLSVSPEWRHLNRLDAKHLRDKPNKLIVTAWCAGAGPALLTDIIFAQRHLPPKVSGVSGLVTDLSDSSQNNKRAAEMASFTLARALATAVPMAQGTAVHVFFSACKLHAFKDQPSEAIGQPAPAPLSPYARIVLVMLNCTFHTYAALAVMQSRLFSAHPFNIAVHGYTSHQTRAAHFYHWRGEHAANASGSCGAMPGLCAAHHLAASWLTTLRGNLFIWQEC